MRIVNVSRCLSLACLVMAAGCASFSNPTTYPAVPVQRIPEEMLGRPREEQQQIPLNLLRQQPPDVYRLDNGDTLGVIVESILGDRGGNYPTRFPNPGEGNQPVGLGYPIPVYEDGKITLPLIDPIYVKGMTVTEAQEAVRQAYLDKAILKAENSRIIVTLFRPRQYHVLVVRQDSGSVAVAPTTGLLSNKRGQGFVLDLNAYENDVLTALARSGGLPGQDAKNEVIIQRGGMTEQNNVMPQTNAVSPNSVRIPMRMRPGEQIPFHPEDVILKTGDIVFLESRDTEVYYVGGLLPIGEYVIPRDYDLDVLEAVAQVHGPIANGGINFNNLSGSIISTGFGAPSPSQLTVLRRAPGNRQITIRVDLNRAMQDPRERILVQPGDVLILQETLGESMTRYLTTIVKFNFFSSILRTSTTSITGSTTAP